MKDRRVEPVSARAMVLDTIVLVVLVAAAQAVTAAAWSPAATGSTPAS